jgi:hypothetical protein
MIDPSVLQFFTKEATGMTYAYLKEKRELEKTKPDPFVMSNPAKDMHTKSVKGLVRPRLATPRPKLQGTKRTPLSISGNPRVMLGLKRNQ